MIDLSLAHGLVRQGAKMEQARVDRAMEQVRPAPQRARKHRFEATVKAFKLVIGDSMLSSRYQGVGLWRSWRGLHVQTAHDGRLQLVLIRVDIRQPDPSDAEEIVFRFTSTPHFSARALQSLAKLDISAVRHMWADHALYLATLDPGKVTHSIRVGKEMVIWRESGSAFGREVEACTVIRLDRLDGPNKRVYDRAMAGLKDEGVHVIEG